MKRNARGGTRLLRCAVLLLLATCTVFGSPILYTFNATTRPAIGSPAHLEQFRLITPDFLPVVTNGAVLSFVLTDPALLSCVACSDPPLPTIHFLRSDTSDLVQFSDADGILRPYFFPAGALSGLGAVDTLPGINVNVGRLVVTETPEPSSMVLVLAAVVLFAARVARCKPRWIPLQ